jgi:hypothetical protein
MVIGSVEVLTAYLIDYDYIIYLQASLSHIVKCELNASTVVTVHSSNVNACDPVNVHIY